MAPCSSEAPVTEAEPLDDADNLLVRFSPESVVARDVSHARPFGGAEQTCAN